MQVHTHTRGKIKVVESDAAEGVCIGVSSGFKLNLTKGEEGEGRRRDSNARSSLPSSSGSVAVREIGKTFLAFRKGKLRGASSEEKESTREIKGRGEFYATLSFPFRTEGEKEREGERGSASPHRGSGGKKIWRERSCRNRDYFESRYRLYSLERKIGERGGLNSTRDPLVPILERGRRIPVARRRG